MIAVKDFVVELTELSVIKPFVESNHYSGSINGVRVSHSFGLFNDGELIGAMIYGSLGMANAWKKYGERESDVVELRRLCCIDDTPKNTESYFIGKTIRYLKKNSNFKVIVSYADPNYGHSGVIYKASNFQYLGKTSPGRVIMFEGKKYHDKSIRTYFIDKNGNKKLKPFAIRIKNALENGEAEYVKTSGKNIYAYRLDK